MLHCQNIYQLEVTGDASSQAKGSKSTSFFTCVRNEVDLKPMACEDEGEAIEIIEVMVEAQLDLVTEVDEVIIVLLVVEDNRSLEETASIDIGSFAVHEGKLS